MVEHTLELTDEITIIESAGRTGNTLRLAFSEIVTITVVLDSAYFIRRAADRAYMRTSYP